MTYHYQHFECLVLEDLGDAVRLELYDCTDQSRPEEYAEVLRSKIPFPVETGQVLDWLIDARSGEAVWVERPVRRWTQEELDALHALARQTYAVWRFETAMEECDLEQLKSMLLEMSDDAVDPALKRIVEKWDQPPTPLQVLEAADACIRGALAGMIVTTALQVLYSERCKAWGVAHETVVRDAVWREEKDRR